MILGSTQLGFSEPLRVQLEQGLETNQIECENSNHVLVERTNGKLACVNESTAQKLGWEIIQKDLHLVSVDKNNSELTFVDVFIKSDIDADIPLGMYSKEMEGKLTRDPISTPFSYNYIIIESVDLEPTMSANMQSSLQALESEPINSQSFIVNLTTQSLKYLKYFPDYVPDGMELKFIGAVDGIGLKLIYAPISVLVNPTIDDEFDIFDKGGIIFSITENKDRYDSDRAVQLFYQMAAFEDEFTRDIDVVSPYNALVLIFEDEFGGSILLHERIGIGVTSATFPPSELYKMTQKAIGEDVP